MGPFLARPFLLGVRRHVFLRTNHIFPYSVQQGAEQALS